jgi:predicted TIM-barrel fold metal-dependent hydrolase
MQPNASPLLEKSPEEYIRDQFYFGTQPLEEPDNPAMLEPIFDMVGPESIMFASDYPHWDFDNPATITDIFERTLDDEGIDRVLHDNASEVFGIDA